MKKIILSLAIFSLIGLESCNNSDINELKKQQSELADRVSAIEEWQTTVNEQLKSLQNVIKAVETYDFITSVTPLANGEGYVINFNRSGNITIKNGEDGETPVISTKLVDDQYYWVIDGEILLDENGNMIPVSGVAPQVKIDPQTDVWYISTDNGKTWVTTYVKATGESIFAKNGCTIINNEAVSFTLSDGTSFYVPLYKSIKIGNDTSNKVLNIVDSYTIINILLPWNLKESDFVGLIAKLTNVDGEWVAIETRSSINDFWEIYVTIPTFTNGISDNNAYVEIVNTYPFRKTENLVLEVTLILKNGNEIKATRILKTDFTTNA